MSSRCVLRCFALAGLMASNILASPPDQETVSNLRMMSAAFNWRNSSGIQWRNYVIENNCTVMESYFDASKYVWKSQPLPFCAYPHAPIDATYIKSSNDDPELIQLFYTDNDKGTLSSIAWTESDGWRSDTAFNDKEFHGFVGRAIAWKDSENVQNLRLYAYEIIPQEGGDEVPLRNGETVVAGSNVLEIFWTSENGWAQTNDGGPILRSNAAVPFNSHAPAFVSPNGDFIQLGYWDKSVDAEEDPQGASSFFSQAVWTPLAGWKVAGKSPSWIPTSNPKLGGVRLSDEAVEQMDRIRDSGYD